MPNRANDWLAQAEFDLQHARRSRDAGDHEWACFAAQQAAEKACKGLHFHLRQEPPWTHSVATLLRLLAESGTVPGALIEKAQAVDDFYIPARYPDSHPEGAPHGHYGPFQSNIAIDCATEIIAYIRSEMA